MSHRVVVAGIGMVPFAKPGVSGTYLEMGAGAVRAALADAGLGLEAVQSAYAGYVYGESACGQGALYEVAFTGVPVFNVNNNCASGSTALHLARAAVEHGEVDCAIAFGFEQMNPGPLKRHWPDRVQPRVRYLPILDRLTPDLDGLPQSLRTFAGVGRELMAKHGFKLDTFAAIRAKASRHAARNPNAVFRKVVTTAEVMADQIVMPGVMTRMMACPPTCGAAAAVLTSERFARRHGLRTDVVIRAQAPTTDPRDSFEPESMVSFCGFHMTRTAAAKVYEAAGIGPEDVDVCELHDCFVQNELLSYAGLGFCPEEECERFVLDGDNTYGGKVVVNPSGGLLSKGHPLGRSRMNKSTVAPR